MFEMSLDVDDMHIEIWTEFVGGEPAPWSEDNYNQNEVGIRVGDAEETFDVWGSPAHPQFDDEESCLEAIGILCDEALDYIQGEMADLTADMSPERARAVEDGCAELAEKFGRLGLDEDALISISNAVRGY